MEVLGLLWSIIPLSLIAVLVLGDRSEPDPNRERPLAVYLGAACLVGVAMTLAALGGITSGATSLTDRTDEGRVRYLYPEIEREPSGERREPERVVDRVPRNHDDDVTKIVTGLIVFGLAAALWRFHYPQLKATSDRPIGLRVFTRYLYVTSFLTLLVALGTAATALYALYGTLAPETAGVDSWSDSARQLVAMLVMGGASFATFRWHWSQALVLRAAKAPVESEPAPEPEPTKPAAKAAKAAKKAPPRKPKE